MPTCFFQSYKMRAARINQEREYPSQVVWSCWAHLLVYICRNKCCDFKNRLHSSALSSQNIFFTFVKTYKCQSVCPESFSLETYFKPYIIYKYILRQESRFHNHIQILNQSIICLIKQIQLKIHRKTHKHTW